MVGKTLPVQLMIDTGSSVSLISSKVTNNLEKHGLYTEKANCHILPASPMTTKINSKITLPIEIRNKNESIIITTTFLVCDHLPFEALIGNDILNNALNQLDYSSKCAELKVESRHFGTKIIRVPFGYGPKNIRSNTYSYSYSTKFDAILSLIWCMAIHRCIAGRE